MIKRRNSHNFVVLTDEGDNKDTPGSSSRSLREGAECPPDATSSLTVEGKCQYLCIAKSLDEEVHYSHFQYRRGLVASLLQLSLNIMLTDYLSTGTQDSTFRTPHKYCGLFLIYQVSECRSFKLKFDNKY